MTPTLNLILIFVVPVIIIGISKVMERKSKNTNSDLNELLKEEKAAFEGIVEEKISEVKDNAIELEIAVKKAGFISKTIEEDLAKLTPKIESYKDYEAAISQYQGQVEALEDAYLEILNRVDTILKERHTIDKTYKRISDVKTKMIELENNVGDIQERLVESYRSKFNEFESELYKRFDALTTNLLARDAHYSSMAEQEKEKISALTEEFKKHVAKKEELFTNQLTQLAERTARENIEQLSGLFEKGRSELVNRYALFAEEVNFKSQDIESRYEVLSQSKSDLEEELNNLRDTIHDRLNSITESSTIEFRDEITKTKETLLASLKEEVEKLGHEREAFLDSIEDKALTLEKSLDNIKDKTEFLENDYQDKTLKIESEFTSLTEDINKRLIKEMDVFSNHIKDVLENEDNGVVTIYRKKTNELRDLISAIDGMSEETLLKAESKFTDISNEISKLREDVLSKAEDDMEYSIDNARSSLIAEINELRADVESEASLLKDKIDETHFQTSEIISILNNKQEEIIDALSLQKEYMYQELEEQTSVQIGKLESEFSSMQKEASENIDSYINNAAYDVKMIEDKIDECKTKFDQVNLDIDNLSKETESNIKENIEKRIELLETASEQIEDLIVNTSDSLDKKIIEAEESINNIRRDIENYGNSYIDDLKYELREIVDSYEQTQMKSLKDSVDSVVEQVKESEKKHDEIKESLTNMFDNFRNKLNVSLEENNNLSESNKKEIINMLHKELSEATKSFDILLDEKRFEMNKMRDELEDMMHRVENGKEVFERNINKVYETVEDKESNLLSSIEERYRNMEHNIDIMLEEKKENLNSLSSKYHNLIEDSSRNLKEEFEELKNQAYLMNDEYKIRIESLAGKIDELTKDAGEVKENVNKEIEDVLNTVGAFKENIELKSEEFEKYISEKRSMFEMKGDGVFDKIEEEVFHRLNELRSLIDGAIVRYKDEIKDIEHHRTEENSSVFKDIENIGIKIREDYEEYSKMLESICAKERIILDEYASKAKDEIEKAREEAENKHLNNEKNYIDDYLNEYSSKIDLKIKEKIDILEQSKDTLSAIITDSFNSLNNNIKRVLVRTSKISKRKTLEAIEKFKKDADDTLALKETEFKEKISDVEKELIENHETSISSLRNELMELYKSLENVESGDSVKDIAKRLENLEASLGNINDNLEYKAKEMSEKLELQKDDLISSVEELKEEFVSFKDEVDEKFKTQADNFIADNEHMLSMIDEYNDKFLSVKKLPGIIDNIKDSLKKEIENLKSDIENKYENLNVDFDNTIEDIKSAVLERNDILELHSSEKELLKEQIDNLKEEFNIFKDEVLKSNSEDIPTLFENEKEKLEETFDNFSKALIIRLTNAENSMEDLKNILSEEKLSLLEQIDNFREDIESVKNNASSNELAEERLQLEMSFNNLKEDFIRLEDLENNLFNIKESVDNIDTNLKDEMNKLSKELSNFKNTFEEKTNDESKNISGIYEDFERLNTDFQSFKEDVLSKITLLDNIEDKILNEKEIIDEKIENIKDVILSSVANKKDFETLFNVEKEKLDSLFHTFKDEVLSIKNDIVSKIESENKDFKSRIEKRIAYFEDNWSDSKKMKNIYASDIREEVNNLRKEAEVKFDNTFIGLQNKMEEIEKDLSYWKENKLQNLFGELKEAKENIENFIGTNANKDNILSEMINGLKEEILQREKSIKEGLDEKISKAESKINAFEDRMNIVESSDILNYKDSLNELLNDYENRIDIKINGIKTELENEKNKKITSLEDNIKILKENIKDNPYNSDTISKINELEELLNKTKKDFDAKALELSGYIMHDKKELLESLGNLKDEVYKHVETSLEDNNFESGKNLENFKNEILKAVPNMDDIVSLFASEKEEMAIELETFKKDLENSQIDTRNFADIFEEEKNKLLEDLDNFKSIIRVESIASEEGLAKKIEEIKKDYINSLEKLLEKEKQNWKESFEALSSELSLIKNNSFDENAVNKLIENEKENINLKLETLKEDIKLGSSSLTNFIDKNYIENILEEERKKINDNLSSFKQTLIESFSNIDDVAEFLSRETAMFDKKIDNLKVEIFKDIPKLEDISELFVEERQSLKDEFYSLEEEVRASLPTLEDINDMAKAHEIEIKKDFKLLEDELVENLRNHKETIAKDLDIFKSEIIERISDIKSTSEDLESERDRLVKEIEDLKAKYDNTNVYSNDITALMENDKEKLMNDFLAFRKSILELIREQDETMHIFDEEKTRMLDSIESIKNEISFDILKKDEVMNIFEEERKNIVNMFESLQKDSVTADFSYLTDSFRDDIINIFEKSNEDFKKRVEDRISHFEDAYSEPATIKAFYQDAIDSEVENIKSEANEALESINKKIDIARNEIDKIEEDKVNALISKIDEAKINIDSLVDTVKSDIREQENELRLLSQSQKQISVELDDIRKEREALLDMVKNSDENINAKINDLTEIIVEATEKASERIVEKEKILSKRVQDVENYISNVEVKIEEESQKHLDKSKETIDNLISIFTEEVSKEMNSLKPNIKSTVKDFVLKEMESFENFSDAKKAVEKLESILSEKIEDMLNKTDEKVSLSIGSFEKRISDYQDNILNELKAHVSSESENLKEDVQNEQMEHVNKLKEIYINAEKFYTDKQNRNFEKISSMFEDAEKEYKDRIASLQSDLDSTKKVINSSVEDAMTDLKQALTLKDEFINLMNDDKKYLDNIETKMKNLQDEFEPSINKLENMLTDKMTVIHGRIDECSKKIEIRESDFDEQINILSENIVKSFNEKVNKLDSIIENAESKYDESMQNITQRIDSLFEEKTSQFDALKSHYDGISESLEVLRDTIADAVNSRIEEANGIIDESMSSLEDNVKEQYEKYIVRLNSNLEQTLSLLMNDAKDYVQKAKEKMIEEESTKLNNFAGRISDMSSIIESLENDMEKYSLDSKTRLDNIDLDFEEKSNILLKELNSKTLSLNDMLKDAVISIDKLSKDKSSDIEEEYGRLKLKLDSISSQMDKYMSDIKVFERAEGLASTIKEDVSKLDSLVNETKLSALDMNKTLTQFEDLKNMHKDILEYANGIKNEKKNLKDTEEKIKMLIDMSGDIQEKFANIAENHAIIEHAEEGIQTVVDLASQIENKLSVLKGKEEVVQDVLEQVESVGTETDNILEKIKDIKSAMIDAEDMREDLMGKLDTLQKDTSKLNKNDKKIQMLISRFDQFDLLIDELGNQRENLLRIKNAYSEQDEKVEKNLERAEYVMRTLESLLQNADKYIFEDGIPIIKPSTKKDKYKGVDTKKEKLIIDLYKSGWKFEQIVAHTNYSREEIEAIIRTWKEKQIRN